MGCSAIRIFGLGLFLVTAAALPAQRGGQKSGGPTYAPPELIVHGSIVLPDGMAPEQLVLIQRLCEGRVEATTYADSKGRFSFNLGVVNRGPGSYGTGTTPSGSRVSNRASLQNCSVRATLPGYHAQTLSLDQVAKSEKTALGEIVLQPVAKTTTVLVSLTDNDVPKNARKEYESGLDDAAKSKWKDAIAAMKKGTSEYPKFATAWLSLGILQSSQNDAAAALRSFAQAIAADDKFALPYIESAALESAASQWSTVVEHTAKAISLDPDSFAVVYYLNAMANVRLGEADAARKSVTEGLRVDQDHAYPDLEYIDGMLRMSNNDPEGARTQFQSYLARTPDGPNADNARQLLTKLQTAK